MNRQLRYMETYTSFTLIAVAAYVLELTVAKYADATQTYLSTTSTLTLTTQLNTSGTELQTYIAFPIAVYIAGRLIEEALRSAYSKLRGDLTFTQIREEESALLTIRARDQLYLDEMYLHLPDQEVDLLKIVRRGTAIGASGRVQITPMDRIQLECIIQKLGDRKLFLHSYVGPSSLTDELTLDNRFNDAVCFMRRTKITIESSKRSYDRFLFDGIADKLARLS